MIWSTAMEDAVHAWIVSGSGLAADHVIWSDRGPLPSGPYISMRLLSIESVSRDAIRSATDGDDIVHSLSGPRQATLELTAFSAAAVGPEQGVVILDRVFAARELPSVSLLLRAANLGVGRRGRTRLFSGTRSGMFDPRAIVEIQLHTTSEISEVGSAIERVRLTTTTAETGDVETWVPEEPPP